MGGCFHFNSTRKPKNESMKSIYVCLAVFCATLAVAGCGNSEVNSLAEEGITADEIAKYEEDLAAVSGGEAYAEEMEAGDDGVVTADSGDTE